ncbi:MAG TPA: hypothetical protein VNF24_01635 [Candidatus Acidoferrales bacterium]|nr:hypothetical protein [Candidatus Acidoferrales bacterium]
MTGATESGGNTDPAWSQYGRALIQAMAQVREKLPEEFHGLILETADY